MHIFLINKLPVALISGSVVCKHPNIQYWFWYLFILNLNPPMDSN